MLPKKKKLIFLEKKQKIPPKKYCPRGEMTQTLYAHMNKKKKIPPKKYYRPRAYTLSHSTSSFFVMGFFQDRVLRTICPGWLLTTILLISAS
jgi:hypothetical protein